MKFRKKPVVIDAFQVTEDFIMDYDFAFDDPVRIVREWNPEDRRLISYRAYVKTLEGDMEFKIGDWIITGIKGERYPCKPDIFQATYEAVES